MVILVGIEIHFTFSAIVCGSEIRSEDQIKMIENAEQQHKGTKVEFGE